MIKKKNNFAYIDAINLYKAIKNFGWHLDYKRFYVWLSEKYGIKRAYIFISLVAKYKGLYTYLQESGFTLIFKEVIYDGSGKPKGNCDADLVLQAARDTFENKMDNALIVASDGDYAGIVKFLQEKQKLLGILSPRNKDKCSILLKRIGAKIVYIDDQCSHLKLSQKEKAPDGDRTP